MATSSWRYVLAAFGFALIAASPLQETTTPKNDKTNRISSPDGAPTSKGVDNPVDSPDLTRACQPGQDDRKSDLCAQWKAADAAADSAHWTWAGFIAACVGLGVGFFTLLAAVAAALFAKKAAKESSRSADQAVKANELSADNVQISIKVVQSQVRAYLSNNDPTIKFSGKKFEIRFSIKNSGNSPALRVYTSCQLSVEMMSGIATEAELKEIMASAGKHLSSENRKIYISGNTGRIFSALTSGEEREVLLAFEDFTIDGQVREDMIKNGFSMSLNICNEYYTVFSTPNKPEKILLNYLAFSGVGNRNLKEFKTLPNTIPSPISF